MAWTAQVKGWHAGGLDVESFLPHHSVRRIFCRELHGERDVTIEEPSTRVVYTYLRYQ
jgi:hypothetical protein